MDPVVSTKSEQANAQFDHIWLPSYDAAQRVAAFYADHDITQYANEEISRSSAMHDATSALLRRLEQGVLRSRPISFRLTETTQDGWDGTEICLVDPHKTIPKKFWRGFRQAEENSSDWIAGDFSFSGDNGLGRLLFGFAYGVEFDVSGLPCPAIPSTVAVQNAPRRSGGAPRKWDWDGAFLHLAAFAHHSADGLLRDDGSEPNQSDIARHLQEWFIGNCDSAPEDSQLRQYGKRFLAELNTLKLRDANNPKAIR